MSCSRRKLLKSAFATTLAASVPLSRLPLPEPGRVPGRDRQARHPLGIPGGYPKVRRLRPLRQGLQDGKRGALRRPGHPDLGGALRGDQGRQGPYRFPHGRPGRLHHAGNPRRGRSEPEEITKAFFVPKLCNQCDNPPCVQVCPVGATYQTGDGVVLVDRTWCIGCGYCIMACPYGVRFFHPVYKVAEKCTFCYHRITKGDEDRLRPGLPLRSPADRQSEGSRRSGHQDDHEPEGGGS